MTRLLSVMQRPVRVPAVAVLLLALSAVFGNAAQGEQKTDLERQNNANNAEAECRSRIVGYVDGLKIDESLALGSAIIDRLDARDQVMFEEAIDRYRSAIGQLEIARDYREKAAEVCGDNPQFQPSTDIPLAVP